MDGSIEEWQVICDGLRSRGQHLLEDGLWSDCEVAVGAGEARISFRLHRTILAMASPVFAAEFFEGQDHESLTDVDPNVFKQLLRYIYADQYRVDSVKMACSLARLAFRLRIYTPIKACVIFLGANISIDNVCQVYETAKFISDSDLTAKALHRMCNDTTRLLNHPSFLNAEVDTLTTILKRNYLNVSNEVELISAVVRYVRAHSTSSSNGNSELRDMFCHIRFLTLSLQEFSEISTELPLVTPDECLAIINKLINPSKNITLPNGLSMSTTKRNKIPPNSADNLEPEEPLDLVDEVYMENLGHVKIIEKLKKEINQDKIKNQRAITELENDKSELKKALKIAENEKITTKAALTTDINILIKDKETLKITIENLKRESENWPWTRFTRTIHDITIETLDVDAVYCIVFSVDTNSKLVGFQLPTQVSKDSEKRRYNENVKIEVKCKDISLLPCFTKKRYVPFNSQWDILLNKTVHLKKNKEYTIEIEYCIKGQYPFGTAPATDSLGRLTVTWLDDEYANPACSLLFEK